MFLRILGSVLVTMITCSAHAFSYPNGTATLTKPVALQDSSGKMISIISGPVSIDIQGKPLWGANTLTIKTAQGTAIVQLPKAVYSDAWSFLLPVSGGLNVSIKGAASDRVEKESAREVIEQCSMDPISLPIVKSDGQPLMIQRTDLQGNPLPDQQLVVNLCAQVVNGKTQIQQDNGIYGCSGSQKVMRQVSTTTQVYTVDFIDPSTGQSVGRIEATAGISKDDLKTKDVTACAP
jgi:hypothetical protein